MGWTALRVKRSEICQLKLRARTVRYRASDLLPVKNRVVPFAAVAGCFFVVCAVLVPGVQAQSNLALRVMAANITSGNLQSYEGPGIRIFQGLKPDVVMIQEFQYNNSSASNDLRTLVDTAFGASYSFFVEPTGNIPNGVVSRYPIIAAGSWDDTQVSDRGFAWAQIDLPGTNDLYVVSVHLLTSGSGVRNTEATNLKAYIQANFPANAWIIIGGDCNTDSRSEACISTFKTFLSDTPIPTDAESSGNEDTNAGRNKPYDYVLPSFSITNFLVPSVVGTRTFPKGLVFDSRVYSPLSDVSPVQSGDSGASNMQHMGVIKDFLIPVGAGSTNPPSITTQPLSQTNAFGGNVTFNVVAAGASPLAYQWRLYGTNISGATAASYTLTNLQPTNAGDYTVVITNSVGSITSAVATLTVNAAPFINSQPQSLSVNLGANAAFNVTAAGGTPLFYQWRCNGTNLPGATATTFTRTNAQTGDAGSYSVVVTNYAGSVTSAIAVLTVNVTPPGVIAQWNFNSVPSDGSTTTGTTNASLGTGTAALVGGATGTYATGDTSLDPAGSTDNTGWNTTTYPAQAAGNKSRGIQFNVSTAGKQNIVVTWSMRVSSTASKYSRLQYTTNGTDFVDFPAANSLSADSVFERKTNDLSAISGVNDNASFAFRIVSEFEGTVLNNANLNYVTAGTGTYAAGGTMRYDMITVSGSAFVTGTAPAITNQPTSQAAAQGDQVTFTVGATGTLPLSYQWRFNLTDLSGATNASYTRSNVQPAHVGYYSVSVSNSAGFTTSTDAALTLIVPQPVLTMPVAGVMQWQGLSNLTYTVQTSTNLAQPNWDTLGTAASASATVGFTNLPATNTERYYRVVYP
jgi:endonuclease/exonuclease/phosphatase family metal-dependent hydrolase